MKIQFERVVIYRGEIHSTSRSDRPSFQFLVIFSGFWPECWLPGPFFEFWVKNRAPTLFLCSTFEFSIETWFERVVICRGETHSTPRYGLRKSRKPLRRRRTFYDANGHPQGVRPKLEISRMLVLTPSQLLQSLFLRNLCLLHPWRLAQWVTNCCSRCSALPPYRLIVSITKGVNDHPPRGRELGDQGTCVLPSFWRVGRDSYSLEE